MCKILIQPVEVVRGEYGSFVHPDLSAALKAQFGQRDFYTWLELCDFAENQNIELEAVSFELDAPEQLQEKYYGGDDPDISAWNPSPPNDQAGWFIVSLHDTEDGPVCWWARPLSTLPSSVVQSLGEVS